MNSLSRDCQQMKENYDNCFNKWFKEEFLKGNDDDSACAELFKSYQECLKVRSHREIPDKGSQLLDNHCLRLESGRGAED